MVIDGDNAVALLDRASPLPERQVLTYTDFERRQPREASPSSPLPGDVVLVAEKESLPASRFSLGQCSEYFRDHQFSTMDSGDSSFRPCFRLDGVTAAAVSAVVHFSYTGQLSVGMDNIRELLQASRKLGVTGMEYLCLRFLRQHIDTNRCVEVLNIAIEYKLRALEETARSYVIENFNDVSATDGFLKLSVRQICAVLASDNLDTDSEIEIFRSAKRWVEADPGSRLKHVGKVMRNVRFPLMNRYRLKHEVSNVDFMKKDRDCEAILLHAMDYRAGIDHHRVHDYENERTQVRGGAEVVVVAGGDYDVPDHAQYSDNLLYLQPGQDSPGLLADMSGNVTGHAAAVLDNFFYVAGGCFDGGPPSADFHRYDPRFNRWTRLPSMKQGRTGFVLLTLDGCIWAIGSGYEMRGRMFPIERYTPHKDKWELKSSIGAQVQAAGGAVLNGYIYFTGGMAGSHRDQTRKDVLKYSPEGDYWQDVQSMRKKRWGHSSVACCGKLYSIGGCNGARELLSSECYSPATDQWSAVAWMRFPRHLAGCTVLQDRIWLVGGKNRRNGALTDVWCLDPRANRWYRQDTVLTVGVAGPACGVLKIRPNREPLETLV
ncbi:kelch-like protein 26 [Branchiostoma floridae x Branchiostoma belcheri]